MVFSRNPCYGRSARNEHRDRQRNACGSFVVFARAWQFSLAAVAGIIMPTKPTIIELDMNKLDDILRRVEAKELRPEDYETVRTVIESYVGLYFAVGDRNTTIRRLRQMLFGIKAPVGAKVYYLQKLRCNLCGVVFTAQPPEGAAGEKYDATAGSMIALLKYGNGVPFNREEKLQGSLGIPLPASTQWDIVEAQAEHAEPVFEELVRQAAQGDIVHNDDTGVKILEMMGARAQQAALADEAAEDSAKKPAAERTGMFTTGIVSTREGHKIALFLSGRQHAGENLKDVLVRRAAELPAPIQMCDALSRNLPGELATIVANCLAHSRRQFVEVADRFPEECRHVLESLSAIYHNDALAREQKLSAEGRLCFHQAESSPVMEELHVWLVRQFDDRLVEPNSALGGAISYLLRHWEKLTLFLRVPGAPLDNNICEQALKKVIRHRRNSLFYKTRHGAHVGDVFMSLIHTCELCGVNPFAYLTELDRHADDLSANPQQWMPWNYRPTLTATAASSGVARRFDVN